jgi:hypothetical protein
VVTWGVIASGTAAKVDDDCCCCCARYWACDWVVMHGSVVCWYEILDRMRLTSSLLFRLACCGLGL